MASKLPTPATAATRGDDGTEIGLSAGEKAARVERIKRDYEEITRRFGTEFSAAGKDFPGGLTAYLRQLALLDREKWKDIAAVLSPRELEDLEMAETSAGKLVQKWLGDTTATEEQRRAVFRLQKEFDDRFALTFDDSAAALYERQQAYRAMVLAIAGVLGERDLFPAWIRNEGADYAKTVAFANERGLAPAVPFEVWNIRNDFILSRLKVTADGLPPTEARKAQAELARGVREKLRGVLGDDGMKAGAEILNWLPVE